MMIGTKTILF